MFVYRVEFAFIQCMVCVCTAVVGMCARCVVGVCVCDVHVCRCLRHGSMERQPNPSAVTRLPQEEPLGTERQRLTEAGHRRKKTEARREDHLPSSACCFR